MTAASVSLVVLGPRWVSNAQDISFGMVLPEIMLMLAWTFGFFKLDTGLEFQQFLQIAPALIVATPVFLFLAFALGKIVDSLQQ